YDVTIHTGDADYPHTGFNVSAEGVQKLTNLSPGMGQYLSPMFTVTVSDGQLTLLFHDTTPADHYVINGLEVRTSGAGGTDPTPPTVSLTAPAAGATVSGTV